MHFAWHLAVYSITVVIILIPYVSGKGVFCQLYIKNEWKKSFPETAALFLKNIDFPSENQKVHSIHFTGVRWPKFLI